MNRQQQAILAAVGALSIFIGVGITLLITSGEDKKDVTIGSSTSTSIAASSTLTLPPVTAPPTSAPSTTPAPPTTQPIRPGTTIIVPPTTRPPTTTTRASTTTTRPDGRTDVGITDEEIRLAVIADDARSFQGMSTWQTVLNRRGGLAGHKIRLDLLATGGSAEGYADAVTTACDRDFAIVGSLSVFDAPSEALGCGAIPDLPVQPVGAEHAVASNTFAAFPKQPGIEAVGPYTWLRDNLSGCCNQYVLVPDTEPGRSRTLATLDAAVAAGFTTAGTADVGEGDDAARYTEIVGDLEATGATFAASGLGLDSTMLLRQAADGRAADVAAWFCDARCYDAAFLADGGDAVDGEYVAIETTPFSDRADVGALRTYLRVTVRAGDDTSYEGLRAYATGLLFEEAARQVVDDHGQNGLTRVRLLDALGGIHDFRAAGLVGSTDVASGTPNGCYVLLRVVDGRFKRASPGDKGALDCGSQNLVELGT